MRAKRVEKAPGLLCQQGSRLNKSESHRARLVVVSSSAGSRSDNARRFRTDMADGRRVPARRAADTTATERRWDQAGDILDRLAAREQADLARRWQARTDLHRYELADLGVALDAEPQR